MQHFKFFVLLVFGIVVSAPFLLIAQDDTGEVHKQTILRIIEEGFNQGDLSVIDELVATDYVNYTPAPNDVDGQQGFKDFISDLRAAMPDFEASVEMLITEEDWIAFRFESGGTFENEFPSFPGLPPTGERVDVIAHVIVRFNADGQIVEEWDLVDNLTFLTQLGVVPPMDE